MVTGNLLTVGPIALPSRASTYANKMLLKCDFLVKSCN